MAYFNLFQSFYVKAEFEERVRSPAWSLWPSYAVGTAQVAVWEIIKKPSIRGKCPLFWHLRRSPETANDAGSLWELVL